MRTDLGSLVQNAVAAGEAVGAFTAYDFLTAWSVVQAGERGGHGVILLVSPKTARTAYGQSLVRALRTLADEATVPVAIQLDHASDLDLIARTVHAGADAVLVDGSSGSFESNIALLVDARRILPDDGIAIEAELGRIEGDEDVAALVEAGAEGLTDPNQAKDFIDRSGVDLLAVSVGNVHGRYSGPPVIDLPRLEAIAERVDVPLVMHGASGLPPEMLQACLRRGVGKVNVNTELRQAVLRDVTRSAPAALEAGAAMEPVLESWIDAAIVQVEGVLTSLSSS